MKIKLIALVLLACASVAHADTLPIDSTMDEDSMNQTMYNNTVQIYNQCDRSDMSHSALSMCYYAVQQYSNSLVNMAFLQTPSGEAGFKSWKSHNEKFCLRGLENMGSSAGVSADQCQVRRALAVLSKMQGLK